MNALARRYVAALRLPPMDCGHRDALLCGLQRGPSNFSMSRRELAAERRRLLARGWGIHEVRTVLTRGSARP